MSAEKMSESGDSKNGDTTYINASQDRIDMHAIKLSHLQVGMILQVLKLQLIHFRIRLSQCNCYLDTMQQLIKKRELVAVCMKT